MSEAPASLGSTQRTAHDGLEVNVSDNAEEARFEVAVDGVVIGQQPYRRYLSHVVLLRTEVDPQWRNQGISSALMDGTLGLVGDAGFTVVPHCKLTGDYILRHPEYRHLVAPQYQRLLRPVSRPGT
jgi:predicted GNAT family acetyltransferase